MIGRIKRAPALCLLLCWALAGLAAPAAGETIALSANPVPLNTDHAPEVRLGGLRWRGGLHLSAPHPSFGGYSGMAVSADGLILRAVSDRGTWLNLRLRYDAGGMLIGADQASIGPLSGLRGRKLQFSDETDAESLAVLGDGSVLVGFERRHRLWRYPPGSELAGGGMAGIPQQVPAPPDLHLAPFNEGLEALAVLADGSVLAIAEDMRAGPGATAAWIATLDGGKWQWRRFAYRLRDGYRVTDAAALPDGGALVLERSFSVFDGFKARLMRIPHQALQAGGVVESREVARFEPPWIVDNFEALATARGGDGRLLVWILSDDNFSGRQRTLLVHFVLVD